eukprot:CAMPEP_0194339564 /NCGR_PEP_ID=MMETSP0171-20130528/83605_1 /TAXON_ID=218684 /ORGANISM="Corethron pennatum, Strain L29A3" /LENGTH=215 /DNA_ID=CAMNT_0039104171 /DNA_START=85 /DNA_END=728 /DNA_ORIENTATION=+
MDEHLRLNFLADAGRRTMDERPHLRRSSGPLGPVEESLRMASYGVALPSSLADVALPAAGPHSRADGYHEHHPPHHPSLRPHYDVRAPSQHHLDGGGHARNASAAADEHLQRMTGGYGDSGVVPAGSIPRTVDEHLRNMNSFAYAGVTDIFGLAPLPGETHDVVEQHPRGTIEHHVVGPIEQQQQLQQQQKLMPVIPAMPPPSHDLPPHLAAPLR